MINHMHRVICCAFCFVLTATAGVIGEVAAQELQTTEQRNAERAPEINPIVVLKSGETFRPITAKVSGEQITLRFADGTERIYPKDRVEFNESSGITAVESPQKGSNKLSDLAGTIKLQDSAKNPEGKIIIVGKTLAPAHRPNNQYDEYTMSQERRDGDVSEAIVQLRRLANDLNSAFTRHLNLTTEVRNDCSGHRYAWVGGRRYIMPSNETAECKDAVNRAINRLPNLRSQYNTITKEARQNGVEPRALREVLSESGLKNFPQALQKEERYLAGMYQGQGI